MTSCSNVCFGFNIVCVLFPFTAFKLLGEGWLNSHIMKINIRSSVEFADLAVLDLFGR